MSLMYSVLAGLSKLDMFGQVVFLRINGQANYKTTLGGCASVSVMGIMVLMFIANFITFIHKEQLKVISLQEYEDEIDTIVFDEGNFIFAIQVEQVDFISKPYFNISMSQTQYTRTSDGNLVKNLTQIPLVPCTIERFTNIFERYDINFTQQFQQLKLYDFLCPLVNSHVYLGGTYSSTLFEYVDLQVNQCQNNSNGIQTQQCFTPEDTSFKLNLLTINQIVNPYKPKQSYIQPFLDDSISFSFNQRSTKSASIFFTKYQFSNDESLLPISMIEEETFFVLDSSDVKQDTAELTDDCYIKLMLKKKPFVSKFQRQYQKFDELLSNIGGILQIVSFFIGIIMIIFNRINYMIELANKIYEFSLNESQTHKVYENNLQFLKTQPMFEQKPSSNIIEIENGQNFEVDVRKNFRSGIDYFSNQLTKMFEQNKPINLDIMIFVNYITCNKLFKDVPRVLLINKAYDQIIQQSDILTILSRLNEIEKLKEVLLTPKQMVMFNFTPKPLITLEDEELKIDRNLIESRAKTPKKSADEILFRKMLVKQHREIQKNKDKEKQKNPLSKQKEGFKNKLQRLRTKISNYASSNRRQSFLPQPLNNFMYQEIYSAYEELYQKNDKDPLSQHLIKMLGPELETIYKVCKLLDEEEQRQFLTDKGQQKIISDFQSRNGLLEQEVVNQQDNIQQE